MAPLVEGYRGAEHVVGPLHIASVNWLLMAATFPVKKEARASAVRQTADNGDVLEAHFGRQQDWQPCSVDSRSYSGIISSGVVISTVFG
ncbi:hypothetical protein SRHO_G00081320 [Serrasalmus rhombeus]